MLEQVKRWDKHIGVWQAEEIFEEHFTILLFISPVTGKGECVYEERLGYTERNRKESHLANTY